MKRAAKLVQDPRIAVLKTILYENPVEPVKLPKSPKFHSVNVSTPAELERDQIERMWSLVKQQEAYQQTQSIKEAYLHMKAAMLHLEKNHPHLFQDCLKKQSVTTFPKIFRVPTETAPLGGWPNEVDKL
jgi:hypothetical protein